MRWRGEFSGLSDEGYTSAALRDRVSALQFSAGTRFSAVGEPGRPRGVGQGCFGGGRYVAAAVLCDPSRGRSVCRSAAGAEGAVDPEFDWTGSISRAAIECDAAFSVARWFLIMAGPGTAAKLKETGRPEVKAQFLALTGCLSSGLTDRGWSHSMIRPSSCRFGAGRVHRSYYSASSNGKCRYPILRQPAVLEGL